MATAYVNAAIYTADPAHPWASDARRARGRGLSSPSATTAEAANAVAAADEIVDLGGRMVMPCGGPRRSHAPHKRPQPVGGVVRSPMLARRRSSRRCARRRGPRPVDAHGNRWLVGGPILGPERPSAPPVPTGRSSTATFPDEPVMLHDRSAHNVLVNSRALRTGRHRRLRRRTGRNGKVVRAADGRPTGELHEQAHWPVFRVMVVHDDDVMGLAVRHARDLNHRYGVTSVQDASSTAQLQRVLRAL